jgi:hypothetical protein
MIPKNGKNNTFTILIFMMRHCTISHTLFRKYERDTECNYLDQVVKLNEKNEMGGACGAYGGGERCAQGAGGET